MWKKICLKKNQIGPVFEPSTETLLVAAIPMKSLNWTEMTNLQSKGRKNLSTRILNT